MFAKLRREVDIVEVASKLLDVEFKLIAENTWTPEDRLCPFCGHRDCFRIKVSVDEDETGSFFKCFSCDETGDVTDLVAKIKEVTNVEAAKFISKEFNIPLPRDLSPLQEIFTLAAEYYHQCLLDAHPMPELNGLTPIEYQEQIRRHKLDSLNKFSIGWSNGGLVNYLVNFGIDINLLRESGLAGKKSGDFLPSKVFIYPHFVRGRVSHFTFKDPLKKIEYQVPSKSKLNGHIIYNSDSIALSGPVILVEGENDLLSVYEAGWKSGILCCNGSISAAQLEWIVINLENRDVITIFDSDPAGDKYREKVGKLANKFKSLTQVRLSGVKDIDEYLKAGGNLQAAIETQQVIIKEPEKETDISDENIPIIEANNCYYKVRYKDGIEYKTKLTNFVIRLRNIFIRGIEREREVIIIREDGAESDAFIVPSEAKVSLRSFRTLVANAVDGSFYGREEDMIAVWEFAYKSSTEKLVQLPDRVGRLDKFKGWLFKDCFITDTGAVYTPDEEGAIWILDKTLGIRPVPISENEASEMSGIPTMKPSMVEEDRRDLLKNFAKQLAKNLGGTEGIGDVLTILGWVKACAFSNSIFKASGSFPFLYLWGRNGKGKTIILRWLLSIYGMGEAGFNTTSQLNSGVGFSRKLAYYASLPMCIDEIRIKDTQDWYSAFRAWWQRVGRTVASKEGFGVRDTPVRSTILFGGEDQFVDPATRQRCIPIRIRINGRETAESYNWIKIAVDDFHNIGFDWIVEAGKRDFAKIYGEMKELKGVLKKNGISDRTADNWTIAGYFGLELGKEIFPDYNYMEYLAKFTKEDATEQEEDDTLTKFWELIEGLQSEENPKISRTHFRRDGELVYVWFSEIFRIVKREDARNPDPFSSRAIKASIIEEPYFVVESRKRVGLGNDIRRVLVFNFDKMPDSLKTIVTSLE